MQADHAEDGALALVALQLADAAEDPLLGVVAHRTGVDEDHVGLVGGRHRDHPLAPQDAGHELGVGHVHLNSRKVSLKKPVTRFFSHERPPSSVNRAVTRERPATASAESCTPT